MKINEFPEKIYLTTFGFPLWFPLWEPIPQESSCPDTVWSSRPYSDTDSIEYTRTDIFIEKACEFIRKGGMRGDGYIVTEFGEEVFDFIQFAEHFRKYMEEE